MMYRFILHLYNYPYSNMVGIIVALAVAFYGGIKLILDFFHNNLISANQIIYVILLGLIILALSHIFVVILKILAFKSVLDNDYQYDKFVSIHHYDPIVKFLVKIKNEKR